MNVIVDTSVWSLALRRQRPAPRAEFAKVIPIDLHSPRASVTG